MFLSLFFLAVIPALTATIYLYYSIFYITAQQFGTPEAITYALAPASRQIMSSLFIATPLVLLVIMLACYKITHELLGPFERILCELDERIAQNKKDPITIRKNDKFVPLIDRVNQLLKR